VSPSIFAGQVAVGRSGDLNPFGIGKKVVGVPDRQGRWRTVRALEPSGC
jgi:hypothetical protein